MVKNFKIDKVMISVTVLLCLLGLIMVYSSTMIIAKEEYGDSFLFLKKHLLWLAIGFLLFTIIALLTKPLYLQPRFVYLGIVLAIAALVLVFFSPKINNSYRWILFAGLSVQPSEFVKIAVVVYLAYILGKRNSDLDNIKKLLLLLSPIFLIELLILKQPDLGNFLLILVMVGLLLFVAGLKIRYFFAASFFLAPLMVLVIKMNPEKVKRLLAFLDPEAYIDTYGFQAVQSVCAVGSGGLFGQGLGNSTQKLYFLPYAYSDFIFSIIGEELGLLGALVVVGLFFVFLIRGLNIAKLSGHRQTYLLVVGLTFLVVIQAMVNISVALAVFPTSGITLPFISNGGSSLISNLMIAGIIVNVSRHRKMVLADD